MIWNKQLTAIRGIAVLLVFTAHTPIRHVIGDFGQEAVYIFFFLSSYLLTISLEKQKISTFYEKRFRRIYPAYIFATVIVGIIINIGLLVIIQNLLFLQQVGNNFIIDVSWSLIVEMQLYLLLPIITKLIKQYDKKVVIITFILIYALRIILMTNYLIRVEAGSMKVMYGTVFEYLDIFVLASYLATNRSKVKSVSTYKVIILSIIFIISPKLIETLGINRAVAIVYLILPLYTYITYQLFVTVISKNKISGFVLNNKLLYFFGTISYSFYLIHIPILRLMKETSINPILQGGIGFGLITIIAYVMYKQIEIRFNK